MLKEVTRLCVPLFPQLQSGMTTVPISSSDVKVKRVFTCIVLRTVLGPYKGSTSVNPYF